MKRQLGPYHLVESLGVGGMAEVFLAHARREGDFVQPCVVKILHSELVNDENFTGMLVEEAKLVARLRHNNIASLYDVGRHDGEMFLVMEHVNGQDLHNILARASRNERLIPMAFAVHVARQMCAGLHFAHTRRGPHGEALNLVHRDISPPNVLVSAVGEVKVIDFGVAKFNSAAREKTRAGIIKGKFGYMSPEQAWDENLDHRSDLFSVGICLYEMLTGRSLYGQVEDAITMIRRAREADISPVTKYRPDIPVELARTVHRALAANRDDRFQSAHEMERQLAVVLAEEAPDYTSLDAGVFVDELFDTEDPAIESVSPSLQGQSSSSRRGIDDITRNLEEDTRPIADVPHEVRATDGAEPIDLADVVDSQLDPDDDATVDFSFTDLVGEKTELFDGNEFPEPPRPDPDPPRQSKPSSRSPDKPTAPIPGGDASSGPDEKTRLAPRNKISKKTADNPPQSRLESNPLVSRSGRYGAVDASSSENKPSGDYSRNGPTKPIPSRKPQAPPKPGGEIRSSGSVSVPDSQLQLRREKDQLSTGAQDLPSQESMQKLAQKAPRSTSNRTGERRPPPQMDSAEHEEADSDKGKRLIQLAGGAGFVLLAACYLAFRLAC